MANAPDLSLRGRFAPMAISPARSGQCRGADSRARRRTCNLYKPPSKWQTPPTCHCEERSDVAISQYYVGYHESSGENVTAFPRLHPKGTSSRFALRAPRPLRGLAMTNLWLSPFYRQPALVDSIAPGGDSPAPTTAVRQPRHFLLFFHKCPPVSTRRA